MKKALFFHRLRLLLPFLFVNAAVYFSAAFSPVENALPFLNACFAACGAAGAAPLWILAGVLPAYLNGRVLGLCAALLCYGVGFPLGKLFSGKRRLAAFLTTLLFTQCASAPHFWKQHPYHLAQGIACGVISAMFAFCLTPLFEKGALQCPQPSRQRQYAFCAMFLLFLAGMFRHLQTAALGVCALFTLLCANRGIRSALLGAFFSAAAMLLGGCEANVPCILMLSGGTAGLCAEYGSWAASLGFLVCVPLSVLLKGETAFAVFPMAAALNPFVRAEPAQKLLTRLFPLQAEQPRLRVNAAARHWAGQGAVCGDTSAVERAPDGHVILMLADGMGMGAGAKKLSDRALALAREFLCAGLSEFTAYRAINRFSLTAGGESFSTLDVCDINLYTGEARFHKCGGEPTFLLRGSRIRHIARPSLPVGVLGSANPAVCRCRLRAGDRIILVTDGLLNAIGGTRSLEQTLRENCEETPASLCVKVLQTAKKRDSSLCKDDMSILCAMLVRRSLDEEGEKTEAQNPALLPDANQQ